MAFSYGNVASVTLGGIDISAYTSNVDVTYERSTTDLPRLGGLPVAQLVGPVATTGTMEGHWDPALDALMVGFMNAAVPTAVPFSWVQQPGEPAKTGNVYINTYNPGTPADDASGWSADFVVDGALV